jgi:thioredoxin-like negative regulator of GroEL
LRPVEARELRQLARTAFAAGQIGRAAALFRQSLDNDADDAGANMGLIQSLLALSKYSAAAEAAQAATLRFPDWPTRTLRPLELYGDRGADYTADLARLEEALGRRPDDPVLLFLSAHALWFDGRREEALARFRRIDSAADDVNAAATARFLTITTP